MKHKRYTEAQIIGAIKALEAGGKVADICRHLRIAEGAFYNWRSRYDGMEVNKAKRLKQPGADNSKLKKLLADKLLEFEATKDAL